MATAARTERDLTASRWRRPRALRWIAVAFTATLFVNAALLFVLEPLFTKLVLPLLGGTPNVWNTCLVFFQGALLLGYLYAHVATRALGVRRQAALHVVLLLLSCVALPLRLRGAVVGRPPDGAHAAAWLIGVLTLSLGLPFAMLASSAPLLQRWFAETTEPDAHDPYFLYAASNFGSLVALLGYPLVIEPWLPLAEQRAAWSVCYALLVALLAACAWLVHRAPRTTPRAAAGAEATDAPVTWTERGRWLLLAAVPSSLLLGVTSYVSTDIASMPLLWVIPLALYLLTFVIAFSTRPPLRHEWMLAAEPFVLVLVALQLFWALPVPGLLPLVLHFALLFVVAMVCHGELARRRPPAAHLTEFYVWLSMGGLLGGTFNALVAPVVFRDVLEYPIALAAAGLLRPIGDSPVGRGAAARRAAWLDVAVPVALALALLVGRGDGGVPALPRALLVTAAAGLVLFGCKDRPLRLGLALAAVLFAGRAHLTTAARRREPLRTERSFFGVSRVIQEPGAALRLLQHGTTLHGAQPLDAAARLEPTSYYTRQGPAGDLFAESGAARPGMRRVGVVGLGVGTLACYGRRGERWTYFEIDPVVARIARDPRLFTYLRDCPPAVDVVLGDARLTLGRVPAGAYDVLVMDAFSSDAIPVHLLTREAFRLYMARLAPHGVLAVHISNLHLDLEPVVAAVTRAEGLTARVRRDVVEARGDGGRPASLGRWNPSIWVVAARDSADLGDLARDPRWTPLRARRDVAPWTDDFSNVVSVLNWR